MSKRNSLNLGRVILQLALGLFLIVSGIWSFFTYTQDAGVAAIRDLIGNRTVENIVVIAYGVIEILAGLFLVLALFINDVFGTFGNIVHIIILIVWIIAIVLIDFISARTGVRALSPKTFLGWLYQLANHLIILGALVYLKS